MKTLGTILLLFGVCALSVAAFDAGADAQSIPSASDTDDDGQTIDKAMLNAGRFRIRLPKGWEKQTNDSGAELVLDYRGGNETASIDIYREACYVDASAHKYFASRYAAALDLETGVIDPVRYSQEGGLSLARIRVSMGTASTRVQEHILHYTDDGVYFFTVTAEEQTLSKHIATTLKLLASFTLVDKGKDDQRTLRNAGIAEPLPEHWLFHQTPNLLRISLPISGDEEGLLPGITLARVSHRVEVRNSNASQQTSKAS